MSAATSAYIHATAVIDPLAELADDVRVGPYVVIEGAVKIGAGSILRAHATLFGPMILGEKNDVGSHAVLGDRPQHLGFTGEEDTRTEIGDGNTFRESVTVHRGTPASGATIIGNRNYLMVNSHVGHDCRLGDQIMMANGSLLGGHSEVQDRAFISGNAALHQFARIGRLAFLSGNSASTHDLLPFMMLAERDKMVGINKIGLQRAGFSVAEIGIVRQAYRILFRERLLQKRAIEKLEQEYGDHPLVAEILDFISSSKRGFVGGHHLQHEMLERKAA